MSKRKRSQLADEPTFDPDDLAWCGDELIFVAGHTEAGYPYGVSVRELRRDAEREARGAGWARAKYVLRTLLEREVGAVHDVGWVKKIGDGLSREIFAAEVEFAGGDSDDYVVALPRRDADRELDERTHRELRLLARLRSRELPFRIPETIGAFPDGDRFALIRRYVRGIELELRAGRQGAVQPWEIVAKIAAATHSIPAVDVEDVVPGTVTRREHALDAIKTFDGLTPIEMTAARAWALENLPSEDASTLLHGDLLGQNILIALDGPHHVIDWEYARRGDPAYDLAIVTRGVKQPFQIPNGLERLLEAYCRHGGGDLEPSHVHLYELALIAGSYRDALAGLGAHPPAHELDRMRSLLRRLR